MLLVVTEVNNCFFLKFELLPCWRETLSLTKFGILFPFQELTAVIVYVMLFFSLFKHYKAYEYLFHGRREEPVISNEVSHLYRWNSLCRVT